MRTYEKVTEQVTTKKLKVIRCDLCDRKATTEDWDAAVYDTDDTTVKVEVSHVVGVNYPEGGQSTTYRVDICPSCFEKKLIPWLVSQGADIEPIEVDW